MSSVAIGLFAGLLLALVAAVGGFDMFMLAVVLAAVGVVVGLVGRRPDRRHRPGLRPRPWLTRAAPSPSPTAP